MPTAPNHIIPPGVHLYPYKPARSRTGTVTAAEHAAYVRGAEVVIHAMGRFRLARIVKVGPKNTRVAYGTNSTAYREKSVPHTEVYSLEQQSDLDGFGVIRERRTHSGKAGGHELAIEARL